MSGWQLLRHMHMRLSDWCCSQVLLSVQSSSVLHKVAGHCNQSSASSAHNALRHHPLCHQDGMLFRQLHVWCLSHCTDAHSPVSSIAARRREVLKLLTPQLITICTLQPQYATIQQLLLYLIQHSTQPEGSKSEQIANALGLITKHKQTQRSLGAKVYKVIRKPEKANFKKLNCALT